MVQNTVTRMWRMQCSPLARTTWQYSQLTPLRGAYTQADAIPFLTTVTITTIDPRLNQLTIRATDRFSLAISARRTLNSRTVPASMQVIMVPSCAWLTGSSEFWVLSLTGAAPAACLQRAGKAYSFSHRCRCSTRFSTHHHLLGELLRLAIGERDQGEQFIHAASGWAQCRVVIDLEHPPAIGRFLLCAKQLAIDVQIHIRHIGGHSRDRCHFHREVLTGIDVAFRQHEVKQFWHG